MPVKVYQCPADARQYGNHTVEGFPTVTVAFTGYLGVSGIQGDSDAPALLRGRGLLYERSRVRLTDITDGTINTLMVGERPPSSDFYLGWWFAGYGLDGTGVLDVVLGAKETQYAVNIGCPPTKVGFQAGRIHDICDVLHFWSLHTGGGNFAYAGGHVKFLPYSANARLVELATRDGSDDIGEY